MRWPHLTILPAFQRGLLHLRFNAGKARSQREDKEILAMNTQGMPKWIVARKVVITRGGRPENTQRQNSFAVALPHSAPTVAPSGYSESGSERFGELFILNVVSIFLQFGVCNSGGQLERSDMRLFRYEACLAHLIMIFFWKKTRGRAWQSKRKSSGRKGLWRVCSGRKRAFSTVS